MSKKKIVKDENAPKRPQNAYTIFFKHYVEHYNKKNPGITLDPRELISQIAKAWRGLSENDRSVSLDNSIAFIAMFVGILYCFFLAISRIGPEREGQILSGTRELQEECRVQKLYQ